MLNVLESAWRFRLLLLTLVLAIVGMACGGIYAALAVLQPGGLEFAGMERDPNLHDHVYFSFVGT